jgi:hypothetical protein
MELCCGDGAEKQYASELGTPIMTKIAVLPTLLVYICLLPAVPAQAAAARTFVSAAGSDSNNCTNVATPCRHLAAAYAATAANGEIYVLDPANYGSLTITGPVSIEGHGWASIAPVSLSPAITINANTGDKINIIGVVLDGTALSGTIGIQFNGGGSLTVRDSVIRNFTSGGIIFLQNSSTMSQLYVTHTLVSDNGGNGISFLSNGSGAMSGVLSHVDMENNGSSGLFINNGVSPITVSVSDSVSANNAGDGVFASSSGGTAINIFVRNSKIANNGVNGLQANGTGTNVLVTRSTITGNNVGWLDFSGGAVVSYADNNIDGNGSTNTEPPSPLTYK